MPRIVITAGAQRGMDRCRRFLVAKNPVAAARAAETIAAKLDLLEKHPQIGRPFGETPELRELVIAFGDSGYIALYRYVEEQDIVFILAFRHQREAGY